MSHVAVRCVGLSKAFGTVQAVDRLDLTVQHGEILALLGPSGCGKTTALRLIAGFETPDAGRIEIGGRLVAGEGVCLPPEQRHVGMVFQNYALFPHMTVAENVAYGLKRGRDRAARVQEVLELVALSGLEARLPHELSGGQQQRVALARALAPQPEVLLMDEPFSNLDAGLRAQVRREIRAILKVTETTVIFVTHDQDEALLMGDRVAILYAGRSEQVGSPEEVFHTPATRFVADFLDLADFLPGELVQHGIQTELGLLKQGVPGVPGRHVDVMVRPHDVALHPDSRGPGVVVDRQFRGAEHLYSVRLPSGLMIRSSQPHIVDLPLGSRVRVEADPGHNLVCFEGHEAIRCSSNGDSPSIHSRSRKPATAARTL